MRSNLRHRLVLVHSQGDRNLNLYMFTCSMDIYKEIKAKIKHMSFILPQTTHRSISSQLTTYNTRVTLPSLHLPCSQVTSHTLLLYTSKHTLFSPEVWPMLFTKRRPQVEGRCETLTQENGEQWVVMGHVGWLGSRGWSTSVYLL